MKCRKQAFWISCSVHVSAFMRLLRLLEIGSRSSREEAFQELSEGIDAIFKSKFCREEDILKCASKVLSRFSKNVEIAKSASLGHSIGLGASVRSRMQIRTSKL